MKTVGLMKVLLIVIPMVIMLRYPFIQDLTVTSVTPQNGQIIITGTVKVLLTDEAWTQFGYKDGNFEWFNEWWQTEAPGMTKGPFRLVSMTWILNEHTETYDELRFTLVLERRGKKQLKLTFFCVREKWSKSLFFQERNLMSYLRG
jgi:hypothetical protein